MQIFKNLHAFLWESMTVNNCNTFFIDGPTRILIDPGLTSQFEHVRKGLEALGVGMEDLGLIICTHSHPDHIEAAQLFKQNQALITFHETEWRHVNTTGKSINAVFGLKPDSLSPDFFIREGVLNINGLELDVLQTPGHTPGSVSIYWPDQKVLFPGDVIFKEGVGRTDFPGGDGNTLKKSIRRLMELEIEWVLPGHGDLISGAKEVKANFDQIENFWFNYM